MTTVKPSRRACEMISRFERVGVVGRKLTEAVDVRRLNSQQKQAVQSALVFDDFGERLSQQEFALLVFELHLPEGRVAQVQAVGGVLQGRRRHRAQAAPPLSHQMKAQVSRSRSMRRQT